MGTKKAGKVMNKNVYVVNHPLVAHNLSVLRDKNSDTEKFNHALKRISYALFLRAQNFFQPLMHQYLHPFVTPIVRLLILILKL